MEFHDLEDEAPNGAKKLAGQPATALDLEALRQLWSFDFTTRDYPAGQLRVASYHAVEQMSELYYFDIQILVDENDYDEVERKLLATAGTLLLGGDSLSERVVHGIVTRVDVEGMSGDRQGRHKLTVRLSPTLSLLQHRQNSRIFQDVTCQSIVSSLLDSYRIHHEWRLSGKYTARSYCVQYQETDYDFIRRILADDGIYFFFESKPGDTEELLVFGDDAAACQAIAGASSLRFSDSEGEMFNSGEAVSRFARRAQVRPASLRIQRYDFERPRFDSHGEETPKPKADAHDFSGLQVYDHEQIFDGVSADSALAKQHLEQHRRDAYLAFGESRCRALQVGRYFTLTGNPMHKLDGSYRLLRLEHRAVRPEYTAGQVTDKTYQNSFECVPREVSPRPPRPARQQRQILETATVVGPDQSEIHTDQHGRIKVQFHWDRDGAFDAHSSCWLRTMQSWAGTGWGSQFIPRVGMEVLVQFLGGDADSPIVVGAVYNGLNTPPFPLPRDKTLSGIRTNSTKGGGGFNELSFEDRKGYERVYVHAQKDLDESVEHNHTATVQNDEVIRVGNCQTEQVGVNRTDIVGGDAAYDVGGGRSISVGRDDSLAVGGMRTMSVAGSLRQNVGIDQDQFVGQSASLSIGGAYTCFVGTGYELCVGEATSENSYATLAAHGDMKVLASKHVTVEAGESLTLLCGETRVVLTPDGVTIAGRKLHAFGDDEIALDTGSGLLKLDENFVASARKSEVHSDTSALVLDADAHLDGTLVMLNCGYAPAPAEDGTDDSLETKPFSFTLLDHDDKPYRNKRYELYSEGRRWKGTTDGNGTVKQDIPVTAHSAKVAIWVTDKIRLEYVIELHETPPPSDVRGAQIRLRNLAYYQGDIHGELDEGTTAALLWFQDDYDLEKTGELDQPTQAKLAEMARF
jgi:type VI secretion system secreted protein VgrG